ncbi:MAG: hypothetical protein ACXQTR_06105 [Candidatus Methanospirareceae archaeon]
MDVEVGLGRVRRVLWSGLKDLIQERMKKGRGMIEVRPERYIDRPCLDITLNRQDLQSKLGYIMLSETVTKY